ncbi:hypothetical protein SAMN05421858_2222 [Haladaptatus litoreus]|uniref:Uncharacterized protein n=1 Tax=Haladaptatus litoreus TaxID=553468 RepID=A0A1N6ZXM1_9EURY|nr:hypothetical protein [Haladaptatus litoreus]SIR31594.1 hypothetical protein SAMN05421858_2222 [Haladaptatus litoreus]
MATASSDRDVPITDSRAYRVLKFLKLLLTVVTLVVAVWKGLNGALP